MQCSERRSRHSKSRFNNRNRASTIEIALQHSTPKFNVLKSNFNVQKRNFNVRKTNFNVRKINFNVRKSNFNVRKTNFNVRKSNLRVRKVNINMQRTNFRVRKSNFRVLNSNFHTRKQAPSTRKRQNDRILRLKRYGSRGGKQKFANLSKFSNFAHCFNSAPHQASAELHPSHRRLKILFQLCNTAK